MKDSATGDFKIPELHDKLVTLKNNYKLLHPGEDFNGIAIIQSDKNVEFKMLKKIMYSVAVAGYQNVNFAVTPQGQGRRLADAVDSTPHVSDKRPALTKPAVSFDAPCFTKAPSLRRISMRTQTLALSLAVRSPSPTSPVRGIPTIP